MVIVPRLDENYYGFHGHQLINSQGVISGFTLTGANGSERSALWEITQNISFDPVCNFLT